MTHRHTLVRCAQGEEAYLTGHISLQSGATSPTISNQVTISPTKHRLRLQLG